MTKDPGVREVYNSRQLVEAMGDPSVTTAIIRESITFDTARNVTVKYPFFRVVAGKPVAVVDFGSQAGAILVGPGKRLAFENIILKGVASRFLPRSRLPDTYAERLGIWPSVVPQENSTVEFINCTVYHIASECGWQKTKDVKDALEVQYGPGSTQMTPAGGVLLLGDRTSTYHLSEGDDYSQLIGNYTVRDVNTTTICFVDPLAPMGVVTTVNDEIGEASYSTPAVDSIAGSDGGGSGGDGGSSSTVAVAVSVAVALAAAAVVLAALLILLRRRRRRDAPATGGGDFVGGCDPDKGTPMLEAGYGGDCGGDDGGGSFRGGGSGSDGGSCCGDGTMQLGGSRPNSNGVQLMMSSVWRARYGVPRGLQLEQMIGRGAFGRVYQGKWNGSLVAVKVVEQREGTVSEADQLSVTLSHPNVVSTYKIWCQPHVGLAGTSIGSVGLLGSPQGSSTVQQLNAAAAADDVVLVFKQQQTGTRLGGDDAVAAKLATAAAAAATFAPLTTHQQQQQPDGPSGIAAEGAAAPPTTVVFAQPPPPPLVRFRSGTTMESPFSRAPVAVAAAVSAGGLPAALDNGGSGGGGAGPRRALSGGGGSASNGQQAASIVLPRGEIMWSLSGRKAMERTSTNCSSTRSGPLPLSTMSDLETLGSGGMPRACSVPQAALESPNFITTAATAAAPNSMTPAANVPGQNAAGHAAAALANSAAAAAAAALAAAGEAGEVEPAEPVSSAGNALRVWPADSAGSGDVPGSPPGQRGRAKQRQHRQSKRRWRRLLAPRFALGWDKAAGLAAVPECRWSRKDAGRRTEAASLLTASERVDARRGTGTQQGGHVHKRRSKCGRHYNEVNLVSSSAETSPNPDAPALAAPNAGAAAWADGWVGGHLSGDSGVPQQQPSVPLAAAVLRRSDARLSPEPATPRPMTAGGGAASPPPSPQGLRQPAVNDEQRAVNCGPPAAQSDALAIAINERGSNGGECDRDGSGGGGGDGCVQLYETWMVLEYCDRGSLLDVVCGNRALRTKAGNRSMGALYRCLIDVAAGMQYLHSLGVIHGDLKAANVLLKSASDDIRKYTCKIADFGLSRVFDAQQTCAHTSRYGTLAYAPPELLQTGKLTKGVDVYAFGMIAWELFVARPVMANTRLPELFAAVMQRDERPIIPKDCPPDLAATMRRCWETDPSARPTFGELLRDLSQQHTRMVLRRAPSDAAADAAGPPPAPHLMETSVAALQMQEQAAEAQRAVELAVVRKAESGGNGSSGGGGSSGSGGCRDDPAAAKAVAEGAGLSVSPARQWAETASAVGGRSPGVYSPFQQYTPFAA